MSAFEKSSRDGILSLSRPGGIARRRDWSSRPVSKACMEKVMGGPMGVEAVSGGWGARVRRETDQVIEEVLAALERL